MGKLLQKLKGGKKKKHQNDVDELEWLDFDEDEEYEDDDDGYEDEEEYEDDEYADDEEEYEDDEYADEYVEEEYEDDEYADDEEEYEDDEYADDEEEYEDGEYADDEEEYEDDGYADEEEEYEDDEYADEDDEYEDDEYYEDEEYDEDDEYYEDDEYDDEEYDDEDEDIPESGIKKILYKITNMSTVDYVVAMTGVAVLVLAVVTGTLYFGARSSKAQVEAFAEVGEGMESIQIIGQSGLMAIADAQASRMAAADIEEEEGEDSEEEETNGEKEVVLNLTSIQKDLKIKFINKKSGKLIPSIAFEVEIEKPSGGTYTMKDEDKDGIIYQTNIEPGKYKVRISAPASGSEYQISSETVTITVKDTIEYKKVDIADEVKTESQVNVAVEDTKVNETVVESENKDTVEWVESTKTLIEGTGSTEESYEKVDRNNIADPEQQARGGFRLLAAAEDEVTGFTQGTGENKETEEGNGEEAPADEPEEEPTKEPEPTDGPTQEPTDKPEEEPTKEPTSEPTKAPEETAEPTLAPTATPTAKPSATLAPTSTPTPLATATPTVTPTPTATPGATASATPKATITPSATPTATSGPRTDTQSVLKTTSGETLYIKNGEGKFVEAKFADYYNSNIKEFYRKVSQDKGEYKYTGWQQIDGATFFFDKDGNKVTGEQVIQGAKYNFNSDGSLNTGSGNLGIDVSRYNGNIDWNAVKNSGVSYVIIRCGYRGSASGALVEDSAFRKNIQGASNAGLKVGVYFFTQAVNEVEAVEEASMVLSLIKGYNLTYPVFLDVEVTSGNNGRADHISVDTRTAVCNAFCQTIQNSGYKAGIYANKTWLTTHINTPALTGYKIWLAQYAAAPSYSRTKYDMWQYSSKGKVAGISGNVDMNISYMGY